MKLDCELIINSDSDHLQQIYAGFALLHRQKILKLRQTIPPHFLRDKNSATRWTDYPFYNATIVINGEVRLCYDVHDWNRIDENILNSVDFYFKRSYDADYVRNLAQKSKVFPLGLNYLVVSDRADLFRLRRADFFQGKTKFKHIVKALRADRFSPLSEPTRLNQMHAAPDFGRKPQAIFMARAWNPQKIENKFQKEKIEKINENRRHAIRILRGEFGARFFGGLMRDDYSEKYFADVLLPDNALSVKRRYLETLKNFPICVATTGLNDSTGWKFAEYVAFSKAVVSEPLKFQPPGDFAENKNYLNFTNAEELAKSVGLLFENENLRRSIMRNNLNYYRNYVRPDRLVLNTLKIVAAQTGLTL